MKNVAKLTRISLFAFAALFISAKLNAQNYVKESFDGTTFPPSGWSASAGTGSTDGGGCSCLNWQRVTYGFVSPTPGPNSGSGMAGYNSWDIYYGNAELYTPACNFSAYSSGTNKLTFWYYGSSAYDYMNVYANTSASLTGATLIASLTLISYSGWTQFTYTLPSTTAFTSSSSVYVIFQGNSRYGNDQYVDDVSIDHYTACSGTPSVTVANSPSTVCANHQFLLTATGYTGYTTGISYQWQSSSSSTGPWTNMSGATTASYMVTSGITATTYYRCNVTCSTSSSTYNSSVLTETVTSTGCPCIPIFNYGCGSPYNIDINSVVISGECGSSLNDANTGCSTNAYDDRSYLPPVKMVAGTSYSCNISSDEFAYNDWCQIWIDYNDDGTFSSSEIVASPGSIATTTSPISFTITPPSSAPFGTHHLRIRTSKDAGSSSNVDPCNTDDYGETQDYLIQIIPPPPTVTSNNTSPSGLCSGSTLNITISDSSSCTYNWTGPNSYTYTTTSAAATSTATISSVPRIDSGNYVVTASANGVTSCPTTVNANIIYKPVITSISSNTPVCSGNTLKLYGSATPSYVTQTWSGPGSFSATSDTTTITGAPASASGTYTFTVTNNGCITSSTTSVTVYQTPSIASYTFASPTTCTCNCGYIKLTGLLATTTYTVNYTKNGTAVTPYSVSSDASGVITLSGLTAGIFNNVSLTLNGCASPTVGPMTLSNPFTPVTPVTYNNNPVCYGSPMKDSAYSPTPGITYTWSGPGGFSKTTSSWAKPSAVFSDSGTYYVYVTDANGCTSTIVTDNLVVKPVPNTPTVTTNNGLPPAGICQAATLNITASTVTPPGTPAGISYAWIDPIGGTAYGTAATATKTNIQLIHAGTWTVYSVLSGCNSLTPATTQVYVKWTPGTPALTSNSPVCNGPGYNSNLLILSATDTSAGSYTWSGPAGTSAVNPWIVTNPPFSDSGVYSVYITLNGCRSASATTKVIINATPAAPVAVPVTGAYCQYDATTALSATGLAGSIFKWYTVPTGGVGTSIPPVPNDSIAGVYKWYVTQKALDGCESQPATTTITVKTKPDMPYTAYGWVNMKPTPQPAIQICQGDVTNPLSVTGANLLWYNTSAGGVGSTITPTPSSAIATTLDYYVTQTVNGCESDRTHIQIVVKPKPAPPSLGTGSSTLTYCQGDNVPPLSASGSNILWYSVSSGGIGTRIAPIPNTGYTGTFYYYVTQTVNGCESDRAQIKVVINYTPNALIVSNAPYVCQYDTLTLSYYGNADSTASFNWTMPTGAQVVNGNGKGPLSIRFDSAGIRTIHLLVDNKGCRSPLAAYDVDVRLVPVVPIKNKADICQDQILDVSLGYANEPIDKYIWDFNGGTIVYGSNGSGPYGIRWSVSGTKVISLIAVSADCASPAILDTVNVHVLPDAHISYVSNSNICAGDSVSFSAERYNDGYLYQWTPASYFGLQNNKGSVWGNVQLSGYIKLMVTTEYGCTSIDSALVSARPCCEVYFPNAFTPNGDGKNDVFRVVTSSLQRIKTFRIVNRWGQVMFETTNQHQGWDGKHGGVPQDLGTYYYFIEYTCANGKTFQEKGEILLLK